MANYPRKRKSNVLGLVEHDEGPTPKSSLTAETFTPPSLGRYTRGLRFGESVDFVPLSQVPRADGEDAHAAGIVENSQHADATEILENDQDEYAAEIVENSQDADESSLVTNILYGAFHFLLLFVNIGFGSYSTQDAFQQKSSGSVSTMGLLRRESM